MNETVYDNAFPENGLRRRIIGTRENRRSAAFYGYSLSIIALGLGWLLRDHGLIDPKDGLGYWLGIIGGSMMLILIVYPLRKRIRALSFLGHTKKWFFVHMFLGVLGPILVLYHSSFQLGSFNSKVALYCMLAVAFSGIIGRHIYARIHNGLYGGKQSLQELQRSLSQSLDNSHGLATLLPSLAERLQALTDELQGCSITGTLGKRQSLAWIFRKYIIWFSLRRLANAELTARAAESPAVARDIDRLRKATSGFIRNFVRLAARVAQFTVFERLASLWHVLHMPLFFMMVISALIHVLAVHMY